MKVIHYLAIGLFFISACNSGKHESIQDIWIGQYKLTLYFESENIKNNIPYLMDLRNSEVAKIKYLPGQLIETNWNLSNKILTIDSVNYRLISISKDSLVYSPYMEELEEPVKEKFSDGEAHAVPFKDEYFVFKRIKKVNIPFSVDSIHNIISNKIWIKEEAFLKSTRKYADWFEFLDNGIALMKMEIDFEEDSVVENHIQSESWKIETYENYPFLVFNAHHVYQKGFQGNIREAYQITHLETNMIGFDYFMYGNKVRLKLYTPTISHNLNETLYGKWKSFNDTSKFYARRYSERFVKDGSLLLFDDDLNYELKKDTLIMYPNNFEPVICNWRINSDGTIFIFEYRIQNEYYDGYYVEFANFKMKSDNKFELELFYNYLQTGMEKPKSILFNRFQVFERIK